MMSQITSEVIAAYLNDMVHRPDDVSFKVVTTVDQFLA